MFEEYFDVNEGCHRNSEFVESFKQAANIRNNKQMYRQIALNNIIKEKEAMDAIRQASCNWPLCLTASIMRWLEEKEYHGRVLSWWLPWAVIEGDLELVRSLFGLVHELDREGNEEYREIAYQLMPHVFVISLRSAKTREIFREGNVIKLLLMQLPAGRIRAAATCEILCAALKPGAYRIAKDMLVLFLQVEIVAKDDQLPKVVEAFKELSLEFLKKLLAWPTKGPHRRELQGLTELILEQGEVKKEFYEDRKVYLDCVNAMLVGAALIAGLAFQGWLQPPLGYTYEFEGEHYAAVHKRAVPVAKEEDLIGSVEKAKSAVAMSSALLGMALVYSQTRMDNAPIVQSTTVESIVSMDGEVAKMDDISILESSAVQLAEPCNNENPELSASKMQHTSSETEIFTHKVLPIAATSSSVDVEKSMLTIILDLNGLLLKRSPQASSHHKSLEIASKRYIILRPGEVLADGEARRFEKEK
ncbi:hypothetical protein L7F22_007332 [Adiantum nelumboides]|nr:hypothetical protein [Adiantum nelumboides]